MNRCDICLDEKCDGEKNCNCSTCQNSNKCYKFLHATIRITNKCTQECSHCCFSSSPKRTEMMSIEMSESISKFLKSNNVMSINVMGGEFFCNPNWYEILKNFGRVVINMRLVTNADWGINDEVKLKLLDLKKEFGDSFHIAVSNDRWHTNKYVSKVEEFLSDNNFKFNIGDENNDKEEVIVPIGRSSGDCNFYGLFGCYCHNQQKMYSFLIDEEGKIYKCPFGVFDYADVCHYTDGGFAKRFKEFNKKFYSIFIPSCASCIRCARQKDAIIK